MMMLSDSEIDFVNKFREEYKELFLTSKNRSILSHYICTAINEIQQDARLLDGFQKLIDNKIEEMSLENTGKYEIILRNN